MHTAQADWQGAGGWQRLVVEAACPESSHRSYREPCGLSSRASIWVTRYCLGQYPQSVTCKELVEEVTYKTMTVLCKLDFYSESTLINTSPIVISNLSFTFWRLYNSKRTESPSYIVGNRLRGDLIGVFHHRIPLSLLHISP